MELPFNLVHAREGNRSSQIQPSPTALPLPRRLQSLRRRQPRCQDGFDETKSNANELAASYAASGRSDAQGLQFTHSYQGFASLCVGFARNDSLSP